MQATSITYSTDNQLNDAILGNALLNGPNLYADANVKLTFIEATLASSPAQYSARLKAKRICSVMLPMLADNPNSIWRNMRAANWLEQLLDSDHMLTLPQLSQQVQALSQVSANIQNELGELDLLLRQLLVLTKSNQHNAR